MPNLQSALMARLLAASSVTDLCDNRIHWVNFPQPTAYPRVRLQTIGDPRDYTLEGEQPFREARVTADCHALYHEDAHELAGVIVAAMQGGAKFLGIQFGRTTAEGPRDSGEKTSEGFIYQASVDLLIWHGLAQVQEN